MKPYGLARLRPFVLLLVFAACSGGGGGGTGPNQPPVAVAGGPYSTTTGTVTFDGSRSSDADGDALTYRWDFGDGKTGEGVAPSHTYTAVGTFTVSLVVKDAKNAPSPTATTTAQVANAAPSISVANGSVPTGAPYNLAVTFKDSTAMGSPWAYSIDWGDGNTSTGTKTAIGTITASHSYASETSYRVKVTVTDHGGAAGTDSLTVTNTDPVLLAAGDIGDCTKTSDDSVATLLEGLAGIVVPLGDLAYENGTPDEFAQCYGGSWGRHKARTRPVPGNHDYYNPTSTDPNRNADGYFGYFGTAAGDPAKGYYDYPLGNWLVIVLNTGTERSTFIDAGSPQEQWLRAELSSHTQQCVVAMFHHPQFSTINGRAFIRPETNALWTALYEYGVDLILNGHDHAYQRFAPMKPDGSIDRAHGIREIAVGTGGGESLYAFDPNPPPPQLEVRDDWTHGVLKLTLRSNGYDWQFVPVAGKTFTDTGSTECHGRP